MFSSPTVSVGSVEIVGSVKSDISTPATTDDHRNRPSSAITILQSNTDSNYDIPKIELDTAYENRLDSPSYDAKDRKRGKQQLRQQESKQQQHHEVPLDKEESKDSVGSTGKPRRPRKKKQKPGEGSPTKQAKRRRSIFDSALSIKAQASKSIKMRKSESIASLNTLKDSVVSASNKKTVKIPMKIIGIIGFILGSVAFYYNVEGWSILDSVYFVIVTICTVGYGTPSPSTDGSRLFTIFLMFFGIFVIFASISNFIGNSIQKLNTYVKKSMVKKLVQAESLFRVRLFLSLCTIVVGLFFGALFFHFNEGWSFISSFYFAVETSTTVGYGDFSVTRQSTKVFLCFYIIFSTILVAYAINNFNNLLRGQSLLKKKEQMLLQEQTLNFIADLNNGEGVNKHEFVLAILQHIGTLDRERDIDPWMRKFEQYDTANTGILNKKQLEAFSSQQQEESKQEMEEINRPKEINAAARRLLRKKSLRNLADMFTMDAVFNEDVENWHRDYFHLNFNQGFSALRRPFSFNSRDGSNGRSIFRSFSSFLRKESDILDDSSDEECGKKKSGDDEDDSDFGDEASCRFSAPTDSDYYIRSEPASRRTSYMGSSVDMGSPSTSNISNISEVQPDFPSARESFLDNRSNTTTSSINNQMKDKGKHDESYFSIHSGFDV